MADDKILFTIDASQIVVKLHFAGLQAVRGDASKDNGFLINTGIVDDDSNGTPDKVGKTKFLLDNASGTYYAGIVQDFTYTTNFMMQNAMTDIFKLRAQLYGEDGKKLLDKADSQSEEMSAKFNDCIQTIKNAFQNAKVKVPDDSKFYEEKGLTEIRDTAHKLQDSITQKYNDDLNDKKADVAKTLEKYMKVFAGADNTSAINEKNVAAVQVSNDIKSVKDAPKFVKDFEIQPISDADKAKLNQALMSQALKNKDSNGQSKCTIRMCFYVKYKLNIDE